MFVFILFLSFNAILNAHIKFPYSNCEAFGTQYQCLYPKNSFRVRETQSLGEYYEAIDECAEGKCRGDHKLYVNNVGSYECNCSEGYKMNKTGDCATLYTNVNCEHGICKESGNNGF
jgi:hypothetical protein